MEAKKMRVVASAASVAALIVSLGGANPAAACYGNCNYQGGYYPTGGPVVQGAPPVYHTAPVYQAPVIQAAPVYQAPVYQAPIVQTAPIYQAPVVQAAPTYVDGGPSYVDGGHRYYGPRGRTVYYERGPEYQVSYREYAPYDYGRSYYAEPYYHRPYYRPYYRRATVCSGGAYETGQAICGMRP
jgi:hypothetical protein